MSETPEHDKLAKVANEVLEISKFLNWVEEAHGAHLLVMHPMTKEWETMKVPRRNLILDYLGLDNAKLVEEKKQLDRENKDSLNQ